MSEIIRQKVRDKFTGLLFNNNDNLNNLKIVNNLEKGIYNYSIKYCNNHNLVKKWENNKFVDIYMNKVRSIYLNLDSESYIGNKRLKERLIEGEFLPHELAFMDSIQMFPENWKKDLDEKFSREKALYDNKNNDQNIITDQFKCARCKKRECSYYELQTRSADEPMTTFVTCLNCGKRWKC